MEVRVKTWTPDSINQQLDSPIFSRLPAEIRDDIFNLALTDTAVPHPEFTKYDLHVRHGKGAVSKDPKPTTSTADPNIPGPSHIPGLSLLSTCRRIYLETRDLPIINKQIHAFKHWPGGTYPPWVEAYDDSGPTPSGAADLLAEHFVRGRQVRSLRIFASPEHIDNTFPEHIDNTFPEEIVNLANELSEIMARLHTLHLTLRSNTWTAIDWPQTRQDFKLDPYNWLSKRYCLADALLLMPSLRRLTIDFETGIANSEEMEKYISENVKEWQFLVLENPPPSVFKVQGDKNGEESEEEWAYQMVDPEACYEMDGHEQDGKPRSHPPPPSLADLKGDNGELVKWGWLKLDNLMMTKKNPVEEECCVTSYASPLPGVWFVTRPVPEGPPFPTRHQYLQHQLQHLFQAEEDTRALVMRLISYRLEWTFRAGGVPGEHVPAHLWCCDADGRYDSEEEEDLEARMWGGLDSDDDDEKEW
ncbi:hypothetical protein V8F33_005210 [Rhypophila sp. PSN 637]